MDLFPAIDLRDGRCVRLYQGDYDRETIYHEDPVAQALELAASNIPWIHVVDLDAARTGRPVNREVISAIVSAVDVPIQAGGGVRDQDAAEGLFSCGVARVVLGTAALEQPALVARLATEHQIAVGLDARGGEVAVRGWKKDSGHEVVEVVGRFADAGVAAVIVTEIGRDGTLEGPDLDGLAVMLDSTEIEVIASGGVGSLDDLRALAALRGPEHGRQLAGTIVGRALYEGRFGVDEAVEAARR